MSARTIGYPPHAVAEYSPWENAHGVRFTDWTAACGATGRVAGSDPFRWSTEARKAELCKACFPAGHSTFHPEPRRVAQAEAGEVPR